MRWSVSVTARWCMVAHLLLAHLLCTFPRTISAADPVGWQSDLAAAAREATRHGKLLLVVELSDDFAPVSPAAALYCKGALGDERVQRAIRERYAIAYRQVGDASSLSAILPVRTK